MKQRRGKVAIRFFLSRRATALPVSFLMLFVSLTVIVSATYYVSVTKIQSRGKILNIAVAKQNMLSFEDAIGLTKWSPGTSRVYTFEDSGGMFKTYPEAKSLAVNVTHNSTFYNIVYNGSVGKVVYELPAAEIEVSTFYLKGDKDAVINQSAFTMAQLYLSPGAGVSSPELILTYRPLVTISQTGISEGKPINTLRIYIINLSSSPNITAVGKFSVKAMCLNVTSSVYIHNFTSAISSIELRAIFDSRSDTVVLPVANNADGAFVKIEVLVCNIRIERVRGVN